MQPVQKLKLLIARFVLQIDEGLVSSELLVELVVLYKHDDEHDKSRNKYRYPDGEEYDKIDCKSHTKHGDENCADYKQCKKKNCSDK